MNQQVRDKIEELIKEAAIAPFVCDEDDKTLIDQYNLVMEEEDDTEYASNVVKVWEPIESWDIERLRNTVEANEAYLRETIKEILILNNVV